MRMGGEAHGAARRTGAVADGRREEGADVRRGGEAHGRKGGRAARGRAEVRRGGEAHGRKGRTGGESKGRT